MVTSDGPQQPGTTTHPAQSWAFPAHHCLEPGLSLFWRDLVSEEKVPGGTVPGPLTLAQGEIW